jgi:hypothetical protein
VLGFSRSARKTEHLKKKNTALPKAKYATA